MLFPPPGCAFQPALPVRDRPVLRGARRALRGGRRRARSPRATSRRARRRHAPAAERDGEPSDRRRSGDGRRRRSRCSRSRTSSSTSPCAAPGARRIVGAGRVGRVVLSCDRARRSAWWGSRARASRRSGRLRAAAASSRRRASVRFDGAEISRRPSTRSCARSAGEMQIVFQDPYASLDPRMTVGGDLGEPLRHPRLPRRSPGAGVEELLALVGSEPRARATATRTSSRAVSASASVSRGARARARAARARRARLRARRVDPGRRREPARGPAGSARRSRTCSSRTTSRSCATSPTRSR